MTPEDLEAWRSISQEDLEAYRRQDAARERQLIVKLTQELWRLQGMLNEPPSMDIRDDTLGTWILKLQTEICRRQAAIAERGDNPPCASN